MRALSRVAIPKLEPALLDVARYATAAQLERTLRAYGGALEREPGAIDRTHGEPYLEAAAPPASNVGLGCC